MKKELILSLLTFGSVVGVPSAPAEAAAGEADLYCLTGTSSTGNPIFQPWSAANPCPPNAAEVSIAANISGLLPPGFIVGASAPIGNTITMTTTAATTLLAAQAGLHTYMTDLTCSNTSTTYATVTLNDAYNTVVPVPPLSGVQMARVVPLISTGTNTAITASISPAVTSAICSAAGYTGT
jgi:hypothetical protein